MDEQSRETLASEFRRYLAMDRTKSTDEPIPLTDNDISALIIGAAELIGLDAGTLDSVLCDYVVGESYAVAVVENLCASAARMVFAVEALRSSGAAFDSSKLGVLEYS